MMKTKHMCGGWRLQIGRGKGSTKEEKKDKNDNRDQGEKNDKPKKVEEGKGATENRYTI
jgi:hypothetical protein